MSKSPATGRSGERLFQVKEQLIQRPWGRTLPGVWEEQQGGPCVWRTVSERQEEGKEDTEGTWQVMQSLVGCGKKFKLVASFWDPVDFSPPGFSIHGISQARILEWVAIPFSRGSSQHRDWTWVSHIAGRLFTIWATRESLNYQGSP